MLIDREGVLKVDKKKILIVDDEPDVLSVLGKSLSVEGYSVITADNGAGAITKAKSEQPDLIILDILLPDIDGGKVAEKLRDDPETKDIPIVFITCLASKEEAGRGRISAGRILFAKPYDMGKLLTEIEASIKLKNITC